MYSKRLKTRNKADPSLILDRNTFVYQIDLIGKSFGVSKLEDWYHIPTRDVLKTRVFGMSECFDNSLLKILEYTYPNFDWKPWKLFKTPSRWWHEKENQLQYLAWLEKKLDIKERSDWYNVTTGTLRENSGTALLALYNFSLIAVLRSIYPDYQWLPWKFTRVHKNFWNDKKNQREYFDWLATKMGFTKLEDWYTVIAKDIYSEGTYVINHLYNHSLQAALRSIYPEYNWEPWRFTTAPNHFAKDISNLRKYFDWLGGKLNINHWEEWYRVQIKDMLQFKIRRALSNHNATLFDLLSKAYPQYQWMPWKFSSMKRTWWINEENVVSYLKWIEKELNLKSPEDWYKISPSELRSRYGSVLLDRHSNSMANLLRKLHPSHPWQDWSFPRIPSGFWKNESNIINYLEWVTKDLNINHMNDWYRITRNEIIKRRGGSLLSQHQKSLINTIRTVYKNYNWEVWRFNRSPRGYANQLTNEDALSILDYLSKELKISDVNDWYRVSGDQLKILGVFYAVKQFGGLLPILKKRYPTFEWNEKTFNSTSKKSSQRWLKLIVSEIFPGHELYEDYLHPELRFNSSEHMELDIWIPSLNIAFEFHGPHHFLNSDYFGLHSHYARLDREKREACKEREIKLIEVPYSWDRKKESLLRLTNNVYPDLVCLSTVK